MLFVIYGRICLYTKHETENTGAGNERRKIEYAEKKKAAKQRYLPDITQGKCIIPVFRLDKDSGLAKITKIRRKNGRKKIFSWRQGILQG